MVLFEWSYYATVFSENTQSLHYLKGDNHLKSCRVKGVRGIKVHF